MSSTMSIQSGVTDFLNGTDDSSPTTGAGSNGVGLFNDRYGEGRRRLLDRIIRLRNTGYGTVI